MSPSVHSRVGDQGKSSVRLHADRAGEACRVEGAGEVKGEAAHPSLRTILVGVSHRPSSPFDLVTVFFTSDLLKLALAKSILRSSDIVYSVTADERGIWIPVALIRVARKDAEDASALLADLSDSQRRP